MICIDSAEGLQKLRQAPDGHFRLTADIDLKGEEWVPVDFNGTLEGNGKKISHFRIARATEAGFQGFFGCLDTAAQVSDLTLTHLTVVPAENACCVGAFAGVNRGRLTGCTVGADAPYQPTVRGNRNALTGFCDESDIYKSHNPDACVGAIAGINTGVITDALSYLRLLGSHQGLCGKNSGRVQGLYRDVSHRSDLLPQRAIAMREKIVAHMRAMGDFRWIPQKDMCFTSAYSDTRKVYEQDSLHYGLPYTQKYGSLERAQYCLSTDQKVADWLPSFSDAAPEAQGCRQTPWDVYLGNDCSGAVYWSWQRACASVSFGFTGDMVPTEENQKEYGVLPLGGYQADTLFTDDIIAQNGPERIAECLALLRMGDAIIQRDHKNGHTRLAARDPMVMRREDGTIDPEESYLPTHEHGVGKGSSGRNSTWQLDCRYTFRELLVNYLPITNKELLEGRDAPVELQTDEIRGPWEGQVSSNYRIISTTVSMTHQATGKTWESVQFTALDRNRHKATVRDDGFARSTIRTAELSWHKEDFSQLPAGEYSYTVSVLLGTGTTHIVFRGNYVR